MKNTIHFTQISNMEMEALNGGAVIHSGDNLVSPVVVTISWAFSELSRIAMEYQASLPPNLKK